MFTPAVHALIIRIELCDAIVSESGELCHTTLYMDVRARCAHQVPSGNGEGETRELLDDGVGEAIARATKKRLQDTLLHLHRQCKWDDAIESHK